MDEKELQALYDAMQHKLGLGTFAQFKSTITNDSNFRKAFHAEASHELDLGDYNTFDSRVKKKDTLSSMGSKILTPGYATGGGNGSSQSNGEASEEDFNSWLSKKKPIEINHDDPVGEAKTYANQKAFQVESRLRDLKPGENAFALLGEAKKAAKEVKQVHDAYIPDANVAKNIVQNLANKNSPAPLEGDLDNYSLDEIKKRVPNTATGKLAMQRYEHKRMVDNAAANSGSIYQMAAKLYGGETDTGGNAKDGKAVAAIFQDPDVLKKAQQDQHFNSKLQEAKANFYDTYKDYAKNKIATDISQKLEDEKMTGWLYANPSATKVEKAAKMLVDEGKWGDKEMQIFNSTILPFAKLGAADKVIRTTDLAHSIGYGAYEGMQSVDATARDLTAKATGGFLDPEGNGLFQNLGLIEKNQDRTARLKSEEEGQIQVKPSSEFRNIVSQGGHFAGFTVPMILGSAAGAPEAATMIMMFEGGNADKSRELFKGDVGKQNTYTLLGTTIDATLAPLLGTSKAAAGLKNILKSDAADIVSKLANKEITEGVAEKTMADKIQNGLLSIAKQNTQSANVLAAFDLAHNGLQAAFGKKDFNVINEVKNQLDKYKTNWLMSTGVSGLSAMGKKRPSTELDGKVLKEMADNYDNTSSIIEEKAKTNPVAAKEMQSNLDHITAVNELLSKRNLKPEDHERYLAQSLKQKVAQDNVKASPDETLAAEDKKKVELSKIEQQHILNPMSNTELLEAMYKKEVLPKGSISALSTEGKFDESKVGEYLKGIAQQANGLDSDFKPHKDGKIPDMSEVPEVIIKAANERWAKKIEPQPLDQAREVDNGMTPPVEKPVEVTEQASNTDNVGGDVNLAEKEKGVTSPRYGKATENIPSEETKSASNTAQPQAEESTEALGKRYKRITDENDFTDPYDVAVKYFADGGRINPSELERIFGGKGDKGARISLMKNNAGTVKQIAHFLWENDATGKYEDTHYIDAVESALRDFSSKSAMQKDLADRYDLKAGYEKHLSQKGVQEDIDIVEKLSEEEINHILSLDADKTRNEELENFINEKYGTQKANEEGGGSDQPGKQQATQTGEPIEPPKTEGDGTEPPPGKPTTPEENAGGITHAAVAEARKKAGLPDYEGHTPVTHEERISKAREDIAANPSLPDEIMKYVERGGRLTPQDNAVLAVYKKSLDAELESNPTKETYDKISRIAKVLDPEGTYAGQLLESRKLIDFNEDTLTNFLMGKETAQSAPLTDKQVKDETAKFVELKKERDQLAKDLAAEKEAHQKLIAEVGVNKAKAIAKKASKKTREEHIADRKAIVEKAREALKKIRQDPNTKSTIPGSRQFKELKALAPHVKEFMQDLLNEGIDKFDNIVTDIHAEFKDVLDGLRKSDIVDILAGDYNEKKQTKNEKAAQLHLIKREAQLLKELAEARKGSESAKSETVRTEKNRRIAELEKKIKEVRQLNKDKEEAEPVEDKTAGNKTNDELDAAEQKRLLRQIEKLTDDLKNKNYAEEEKQQPVLKMSRKTILQKDKVIALENKIRIERAKDEYAKKNKFLKAWDKVMQVLGIKRIVQTAVDLSIPFRQGATLLSPRRIDIWVDAFGKMLKATFNQKKYDRMMYDIRHSEGYHDMTKDGIVFNELESINPENRNEDFQKSFIYKIPVIKEPLLASNRAADAFLNIARYELYTKLQANLERQGITRQSDPKAYEFAANWAMNMTGRGKMHSSLEKPEMRMVLGNTFYGARLMASRFNLLNPITYFDPKIPKQVRYEAMKDVVSFVGTTLAVGYGLSQMTGAKISLNPWDSDFLQLRYNDKVYDISGGLVTYIRTFLRIADAAKSKFDGHTGA